MGSYSVTDDKASITIEGQVRGAQSLGDLTLDDVTAGAQDPFVALNGFLSAYNADHIGPTAHVPLWVFARDRSGRVCGGLRGQTYWSWATIDVLAVDPSVRRRGVGSQLLKRAEQIAQARGCLGVRLDTTSFQAPDFYRKHGYAVFGEIADYPPGHSRIWLMKRF